MSDQALQRMELSKKKSLTERVCQRPGLLNLHQALRRFGPLFELAQLRTRDPEPPHLRDQSRPL